MMQIDLKTSWLIPVLAGGLLAGLAFFFGRDAVADVDVAAGFCRAGACPGYPHVVDPIEHPSRPDFGSISDRDLDPLDAREDYVDWILGDAWVRMEHGYMTPFDYCRLSADFITDTLNCPRGHPADRLFDVHCQFCLWACPLGYGFAAGECRLLDLNGDGVADIDGFISP